MGFGVCEKCGGYWCSVGGFVNYCVCKPVEPTPKAESAPKREGPPIYCDTSGCRGEIPVGGEGDPEICPACLKKEAAVRAARPTQPYPDAAVRALNGDESEKLLLEIATEAATEDWDTWGCPDSLEWVIGCNLVAAQKAFAAGRALGRDEALKECKAADYLTESLRDPEMRKIFMEEWKRDNAWLEGAREEREGIRKLVAGFDENVDFDGQELLDDINIEIARRGKGAK